MVDYDIAFLGFETTVTKRGNSFYVLLDKKHIKHFKLKSGDNIKLALHTIIRQDGKVENVGHFIKTM